ncbi:MAG: prepilin-type N-terminal cleavage/methylation domain-containing protein [Candidatus Pacebacteria bacterium]|nr:prepilin-type N-terminal cleavage/methylation domain-containing protein [Candidatus Paceibacterota bacterium]
MKGNNKQKGFTLIEAMVAILLLSMFLSVSYKVAQDAFRASFIAGDRVTAFFLAQEIIENVKTLRATNRQNGDYWLDGFDIQCYNKWCAVDKFSGSGLRDVPQFQSCGSSFDSCSPLDFSDVYDDTKNNGSSFKRAIRLEDVRDIDGGQEAEVRVRIEWQSVGDTFSVDFIDYLYEW